MEFNALGFITLEGFLRRTDGNKHKLQFTFIAAGQYGGRQGDEFARLEHKVHAVNTSESDLSDLKVIKNIIKLNNYNGAVKDITRGQQAIKDNREQILALLQHEDVIDSDHVFVIGGMGGGTGNAAVPMILSNLSRVRKLFNGKPTFGPIVSVPGSWEKRGLKKNARWGLSHIDSMVKNGTCGAAIIVDNEKLFEMTEGIFSNTETKLAWTDYGNSALASIFTELAFLTSLPSSKTFDEDELLDVLSTPGYLSLGKAYISNEDGLEGNSIKQIIERSFRNSPTADDYDYELDAVNGFVTVVDPIKNPIITDPIFKEIEETFGKFIAGAEKPHSGLIDNNQYGKIDSRTIKNETKKTTEEIPKAIIYTGVVCSELPARIVNMLQEIESEEKEIEEKRNNRSTPLLNLSDFKTIETKKAALPAEVNNEFDLFDTGESTQKAKDDDDFLL
ncbi:hypothetical protein [Paenibacillus amylolyticus]|uniref:Tubulin/FtsZ GTPase domain-containing protein n=1 Tax=Paenibacillus amylolyticus TaxID=1451 RepID=A0ABD8B2T7_PAEAM